MRTPQHYLVGLLGAGLAVSGLSVLAPAPAHAVGGVFLSEIHYDNTGTDTGEFVEVTAPAGTSLAGYEVVLYNGNGGASYFTAPLAGTVADQQGGWGTFVVEPVAGGIQNGSPDGVALVNNGALVEFFSYEGGMTATNGPANGAAATEMGVSEAGTEPAGQSLQRVTDGSWTGPAAETKGVPNGYSGEATELSATDPADITTYVDQAITPLQLAATGGVAPYEWTTSALPAGLSSSGSGALSGTPTEVGTTEVTATVTDSAVPTPATDAVTFTITVEAAPELQPISEIQGTDTATSPEVGNEVLTEGVVTAMYKDTAWANSGFDGMYIQTAGTGGSNDATPGASDAIFVWGANSMPAGVQIGDSVRVQGEVSEFAGTTEITPEAGGVVELEAPLAPVAALEIAYPTTEAGREAQEGMLLAPTDTFTVSNVYNANTFAEIGLATGDTPLVQPSDVAAPGTPEIDAVKAENAARAVALDDGFGVNYMTNNAAKGQPLPWLSTANPVRVGAEATLVAPVILEYRNNIWKFQPTSQVVGDGSEVVTFEDTRAQNLTPAPVLGEVKIATFNVLNYFNTTGQQYVANGAGLTPPTHCTFYNDRAGTPIANNRCGRQNPPGSAQPNDGSGPRGAATQVSFERQQAKIVTAINGLDADVVSLEELENSIKLPGESNRDDAIAALVEALNAAAGAGTWAYVGSPAEASAPANVAEQDTIRNGFIYKPAAVEPVGPSDLLFGTTAFANAREPLAQAFKPTGAGNEMAFAVIVNHFKSKGDSDPPATGDNANNPDTGAFNGDRVRQAQALTTFADQFAASRGTDKVFLTGDFNAYSEEAPVHALEDAGYTLVESDDPADESYSFSGLSGSLDHVFANEAALATVQGADIWEINADESIAFQYSRFNYNVTDFWQPNTPFAASDHNPEIVGFDPAPAVGVPTQIQLLATNDFHGRLLANGAEGGAAVLSGVVKELRAQNPNTVFAAAGDVIGASTFESFIQDDEPTIDALNEAGLEVSAAGNHEFDKGYEDLVGRVANRADWEYIAANVEEPDGRDDLADTWTKDFGDVRVGFVGAVTEDLPALVTPSGIEGVTVTDIVDATSAAAADLREAGADVVVLLVHEGSPSTDCASPHFTDEGTVWGNITQNTSADVDVIVSGHTHLAYNCTIDGRPVVSAGQYGTNLNQLLIEVDPATGELLDIDQNMVAVAGRAPADPATKVIVDAAVEEAEVLGAVKLGEIEDVFGRAKLPLPTTASNPAALENRGGESTLGNLVAEVQRWATASPESGSAQIAFMNPGGLRADMAGIVNGEARDLSYRQAANVQPFANTLFNMDLTGEQIETVLEQQWQRTAAGAVPSRQFLRLGVSEGFSYTYDETPVNVGGTATFQGEVTGMWLDGVPIDPAATYSVTVNSFLSSGGDNFFEFADGTNRADTGKVDLQAMVDYMAEFAADAPLPVDYSQRAVEVGFAAEAPATYPNGGEVTFDVASWAMSGRANHDNPVYDIQDEQISVRIDGVEIGTAAVDNTIGTTPFDSWGKATVAVTLPSDLPGGEVELTLVGESTGTEVIVPITVDEGQLVADGAPTVTGAAKVGKTLTGTAPEWTPTADETSYQWLADGEPIPGATATTLKITSAALVGKAISFQVTAEKAGYADGSSVSEETAPVTKGNVKLSKTVKPAKVKVRKTRAVVTVSVVNADGVPERGTVTVNAKGISAVTARVVDGKATLRLGVFKRTGKKKLTIRYSGSALLAPARATATIRVRR